MQKYTYKYVITTNIITNDHSVNILSFILHKPENKLLKIKNTVTKNRTCRKITVYQKIVSKMPYMSRFKQNMNRKRIFFILNEQACFLEQHRLLASHNNSQNPLKMLKQ